MSAARPLSSLLSAGAVVALALAAPGTALADPGSGGHGGKGPGGQSAGQAQGKGAGGQSGGGQSNGGQPGGEGADAGRPAGGSGAAPARPAEPKPATEPAKDKPAKDKAAKDKPTQRKPAQHKPAQPKPATQPVPPEPAAPAPGTGAASPAAAGSGDPAGNNGTIKIDTVPGDAARANRPHPGCAFVVQFFGFDAGQTADITFTGQAPTRSAGPLLTLTGRTISTTPADGALEEGHSLTLTAADLGLLGTPTAAKGWHVKVAVDALEAPGGAKQKVFWLDCSAGAATVTQEPDDAAATPDATGSAATDEPTVGAGGKDADLRSVQLEQAGSGGLDGLAVLSESATRSAAGGAERGADGVSGEASAATGDAAAAAATADGPESSTRASALPFTGPAGLAAMLAAGLGAVGAGALALRAGRRRTAATDTH